jgi:hypothetical protein
MEFHCRPADRFSRLDQGSVILEEVAAMAATFLLLTVLVQAATALTARSAAGAAVAAAARRASLPGADADKEASDLEAILAAVVPGAADVAAEVVAYPDRTTAAARIEWSPPGPSLFPMTITAQAEVPRAIPP